MRYFKYLLMGVAVSAALTSCKTPRDITYIQNLNPGQEVSVTPTKDITAQPGDRVSIVVHSQDAVLAEIFNLPVQSRRFGKSTGYTTPGAATDNSNNETAPYYVDSFGDINFPVIGQIHIGGLNRTEIAALIKHELVSRALLKDPTVTVQFLDHSFTALGSVAHPGRFIFDRDQLNVLEAIGLAGDLVLDGMRTNVKVIRMENGKEKVYEIDLTNANSIYQSPAFYIQPNDFIYVEPNDKLKRNTTPNGNSPFTPSFWISLASFATTIAVLIVK